MAGPVDEEIVVTTTNESHMHMANLYPSHYEEIMMNQDDGNVMQISN